MWAESGPEPSLESDLVPELGLLLCLGPGLLSCFGLGLGLVPGKGPGREGGSEDQSLYKNAI